MATACKSGLMCKICWRQKIPAPWMGCGVSSLNSRFVKVIRARCRHWRSRLGQRGPQIQAADRRLWTAAGYIHFRRQCQPLLLLLWELQGWQHRDHNQCFWLIYSGSGSLSSNLSVMNRFVASNSRHLQPICWLVVGLCAFHDHGVVFVHRVCTLADLDQKPWYRRELFGDDTMMAGTNFGPICLHLSAITSVARFDRDNIAHLYHDSGS